MKGTRPDQTCRTWNECIKPWEVGAHTYHEPKKDKSCLLASKEARRNIARQMRVPSTWDADASPYVLRMYLHILYIYIRIYVPTYGVPRYINVLVRTSILGNAYISSRVHVGYSVQHAAEVKQMQKQKQKPASRNSGSHRSNNCRGWA